MPHYFLTSSLLLMTDGALRQATDLVLGLSLLDPCVPRSDLEKMGIWEKHWGWGFREQRLHSCEW